MSIFSCFWDRKLSNVKELKETHSKLHVSAMTILQAFDVSWKIYYNFYLPMHQKTTTLITRSKFKNIFSIGDLKKKSGLCFYQKISKIWLWNYTSENQEIQASDCKKLLIKTKNVASFRLDSINLCVLTRKVSTKQSRCVYDPPCITLPLASFPILLCITLFNIRYLLSYFYSTFN